MIVSLIRIRLILNIRMKMDLWGTVLRYALKNKKLQFIIERNKRIVLNVQEKIIRKI